MRRRKPPQTPRAIPPAMMPIPNAELSEARCMAAPPKCLVTRIGSNESAAVRKKLMAVAITRIAMRPGQLEV